MKRCLAAMLVLVFVVAAAACGATQLDLPQVIFESDTAKAEKVEPLSTIVPVDEDVIELQESDAYTLNDVIMRATVLDSQEIVVSGTSSVGKEYSHYFTMLLVRADKVFLATDKQARTGRTYKVIVAASSYNFPTGSRLLKVGETGLLFCTALTSTGEDDVNSIADFMISQPQQLILPLVDEGYVFGPLFRSFLIKADRYGDESRVYVAPQDWVEEVVVSQITTNTESASSTSDPTS